MKIKKMIISVLIGFGLIIVLLLVFRIQNATQYSSELNEKIDCALHDVDLYRFTSASKCELFRTSNIGLEVNFSIDESRDGKPHRFSLNVSSMSKWEILDEIVRKNSGYYWKEKDGVINIRPEQADNSKTVSPLDMTIPRFEVHQITPLFAVEYLRRLGNENNIPITTPVHEMSVKRGIKSPDS